MIIIEDEYFQKKNLTKILSLLTAKLSTLVCALIDCNHHAMTALFEYSGSRACVTFLRDVNHSKPYGKIFIGSMTSDVNKWRDITQNIRQSSFLLSSVKHFKIVNWNM